TTVTGNNTSTLTLSGTIGALERSLQTLAYKAAPKESSDSIVITFEEGGVSAAPFTIHVANNTASGPIDWANPAGGSFGDPTNWTGAGANTPPGGANAAIFGPGTYTVSGDGAVGEILALGTTTLTGQVTAQGPALGATGPALTVDLGGALTLAGGAQPPPPRQAAGGPGRGGRLAPVGGG